MPRPVALLARLLPITSLLLLLLLALHLAAATSPQPPLQTPPLPLPEPFLPLHDFDPSGGPAAPLSPDPLVRYTWNAGINATALQLYRAAPVAYTAFPPSAFANLPSLLTAAPNVTVLSAGTLRLDFGTERAAWLEFTSPDLGTQVASVQASISEYNYPWPGKTRRPVGYNNNTVFRLETNPDLYEGVRYAWITFAAPPPPPPAAATANPASLSPPPPSPWHITSVQAVAQVKPVNYSGSYSSSDSTLTTMWYTGAYGSRLNQNVDFFGSILMDRGDRVSLQGDSHPTMAASHVSVANFPLTREMLVKLDSANHSVIDQGIMAYPLYWTMSVHDYFWASGDTATYTAFVPSIQKIVDGALAVAGKTPNIVWMGWDDRVGNGWCGTCNPEAQLAFTSLTVWACREFARSLAAVKSPLAAKYTAAADTLAATVRAAKGPGGGPWYTAYGLHAAANAINAGIPTSAEAEALFAQCFNDTTTLCSWSPFNQYFVLQALGRIPGKMDHAHASARLCWGPMVRLGRGCFWELFSPEWDAFMAPGDKAPTRPSYCHPWASGVTAWLSHASAGLQPATPGYARFRAAPHLSAAPGGQTAVQAALPTPQGRLRLSAALLSSAQPHIDINVTAPAPGVVAIPSVLPSSSCHLRSLDLNGVAVDVHSAATAPEPHAVAEVPVLEPGLHRVRASFRCTGNTSVLSDPQAVHAHPYPPYGPSVYPGTTSFDNTTRGNWRGKYGSDGYVLFGYSNGTDVSSLPSYVNNITFFHYKGKTKFFGSSPANHTYLQDPSGSATRALGAIGSGCGDGCQGTNIDINITLPGSAASVAAAPVHMTLYMASDQPGNMQAIRVLDLDHLGVVAPTPSIRDFGGGLYWRLAYTNGVRLRVMPTYGDTLISAIFFDRE